MKNKILTLLLCVVFSVGILSGCSKNNVTEKDLIDIPNKPSVSTDVSIVENGVSEYKIVTPEESGYYLSYAAKELQKYIKNAAGVKLDIVSDKDVTDTAGKYISLGETKLFDTQDISCEYTELGYSGFKIKTVGNTIFVAACADEGVYYGILDLCRYLINLEVYSIDEVVYDSVVEIPLYNFDYMSRPNFDYRVFESLHFMRRDDSLIMSLHGGWGMSTVTEGSIYGLWCHSFPDIGITEESYPEYFSNGQLCLTNPEVIELVAQKVVNVMGERPDAQYYMLGNSDFSGKCGCENCVRSDVENGGTGGTYVVFLNKVAERVAELKEEKGIETTHKTWIMGLMYMSYSKAPAVKNADGTYSPVNENVVCRDDVTFIYAPITMCHYHAINDPNCEENSTNGHYDDFMGWAEVSNHHFMMWTYNVNFGDYSMPYNDFGSYIDNLELYAKNGVFGIFFQGNSHNERQSFDAFRAYIISKLSWKTGYTFDELFNAFFDNYYGEAAPYMKAYYYALQGNFQDLYKSLNTGGCGGYTTALEVYRRISCWPYNLLVNYKEILNEAFAAIENSDESAKRKQVLKERVLIEQTSIDILIYKDYMTYVSDTEKFKTELLANCDLLGMNYYSEGGTKIQ